MAIKETDDLIKRLIEEKGWGPAIPDVSGKDVSPSFRIKFCSKANGPAKAGALSDLLLDKRSKKKL